MKHHKQLERRTFSQDRFDILIKRLRSGSATFKELIELDEIVNRDAAIRESILEEMQAVNDPPENPKQEDVMFDQPAKKQTLFDKIMAMINRLFTALKIGDLNSAALN
jgi:hypothetical protein